MHFPEMKKSWILETIAEIMEKSWKFILWSKYLELFENWKHTPCHRERICLQKTGFQHFIVMEGSLMCEPCLRL